MEGGGGLAVLGDRSDGGWPAGGGKELVATLVLLVS